MAQVVVGKFQLSRYAQISQVKAGKSRQAGSVTGQVVDHREIAKITQWISQSGKLPIKHGKNLWPAWVKNHIVQAVIAVDETCLSAALIGTGDIGRQPLYHFVHFIDLVCFAGRILLGPARHLPGHKGLPPAVVGKPNGLKIDFVQEGEHGTSCAVNSGAFTLAHTGQRGVAKYATFDIAHDKKTGANNCSVLAQVQHLRHSHTALFQGSHDFIFAFDLMG